MASCTYAVILLLAVLVGVSAVDVDRLQAYQVPLKNFDPDRYTGYWFTQGRYIPCSWGGSKTFTDYAYNVQRRQGSYVTQSYWRQEGICSDIISNTPLKSPGIFLQKDPIGNVFSGEWYILDTDYKTYSVSSGCTKPSVTGEKCSDPYISADTRHPHPDRRTLAKIDHVLKKRFGLSLGELIRPSHKNPCVQPPPKRQHDYSYLSKKY